MMMVEKRIPKLIFGACVLGMLPSAFAQDIAVTVNGQPVAFNAAQPEMVGGRVLVPLRGVFEQMGAYVSWNQVTQVVTARKDSTNVHLRIGSTMARINGTDMPIDVPARIRDGSTLVPLRFISEALDANVEWVDARRTVEIDTSVASSMPSRRRYEAPVPTRRYEPAPRRRYDPAVQGRRYGLMQPSVSWPQENAEVHSPLIIKGQAAPHAAIEIHIAYSALTTFNQVRVHGDLGDFSATADENGYFQSDPISLSRIHGANKRYTVTVWSVDNDGRKSAITTLNIVQ